MKQFRGIWFPDDETHLIEWMQAKPTMRHGKGTYQYGKYQAALKYVKNKHMAVDIGANVGMWSRVMALDFSHVIAFEPVDEYRQCWHRTMEEHDNAVCHAVALGESPGSVSMKRVTGGSCGDTLVNGAGDIPMVTLDSFGIKRIDLLKCDNEGYEYFVMRGAAETIKRCKPVIIVEQKPGHGKSFGISDTAAVEYLTKMGYKTREVIAGDYILTWE